MTDDISGSAAAGNPDSGASPAPVSESWTSGLDDDSRSFVETKGWKEPSDVLSGYRNLEKVLGNPDARLTVPGEDATPEDWGKVYAKLGRPETKDGYDFAMPEGLPEGFAYNENLANGLKEWAHEAGLSPRQAQTIHDKYVSTIAESQQSAAVERNNAHQETIKALKTEWGSNFDRNTELAYRASLTVGGDKFVEKMEATGLGNDPDMIRAFAKVGEMLGEDSLQGGGDGSITSAQADIQSMQQDKEFLNALTTREHPGHDAAVQRWKTAHDKAFPE